jgi:hypothetical protein
MSATLTVRHKVQHTAGHGEGINFLFGMTGQPDNG